ncbi:RNA-directed DNA polymerase, eukaryota, reverse transcriptase zinc-binding domain protein [Tanacetum coccineum]
MLNSSTGIFSFQFSSMDDLEAMLENGPWFIRKNPLILKKWNPNVNLLKEDMGNVSVWVKLHGVPVTAFSEHGLSVIATKLGTPLILDSYTSDMCMHSWGRSSYARAMIEVWADVELKSNIVVAMPKITGEGYYTCNIRVEYAWKPHRCTCCKVFGHIQEECPKNPGLAKEYRPVANKPTANTSDIKKKGVEPTKEVSNSNLKGATSSGSSLWNVETSNINTTPIVEKIGKLEQLIIDGKCTLFDDDVDKIRLFYGYRNGWFFTQSLLETRAIDSYENGDYDEDPYDDDMYEGQDLPDKLQDICDSLDIRVRGRRKK